MRYDQQVLQIIYEAIRELNQETSPELGLPESPDTVLIGVSAKLDSAGIVNLVVAIEEKIERLFHQTISIMDLVAASEDTEWTVAQLAKSIGGQMPSVSEEARAPAVLRA
jgi:acyl carrier protein